MYSSSITTLIIIFNNDSENRDEVATLNDFAKCTVFFNADNMGLPVSLNAGCKNAVDLGAYYALLLDQDSVVSDGMVDSLVGRMDSIVAVASPQIIDRNKREAFAPRNSVVSVKRVITSRALLFLAAWSEIGGFDERIFVDWADYDYCANARAHGFKVMQDNRTMILHEMGRREYIFILLVPKEWRRLYRTNHSVVRLKDMARSWAIVKKKYGWAKVGREKRAYIAAILLRDVVLELGRLTTVYAFFEGLKAGHVAMTMKGDGA